MQDELKQILPIQEFDMQMIQLMRLKKERQNELANINAIKADLRQRVLIKEAEIMELKKNVRLAEGELKEVAEKMKKLEGQQNQVRKVEEFNALSHEMSRTEKERLVKEQKIDDTQGKISAEDEVLKILKKELESTLESSKILETEIHEGIARINEEGRGIKEKRDELVKSVDQELFRVYESLLKNKKDRVIVQIENRCCSGCHIMLTAQHENLVRR
ncbi:MAG TPA: hypothetical protein VIH61_06685, partial [Waddliaceae bacterium]